MKHAKSQLSESRPPATISAAAHGSTLKPTSASLYSSIKRAINWFLWPLALVVILHRTWALPQNPFSTDDFTTVWRAAERFAAGMPVYNENYRTVDPHYLYSPGATFLLSPLAHFGTYDISRMVFVIVQSVAIMLGLAIMLRWIGVPRGSWIYPAVLIAAYHTEGVTNTLNFTNVNGSLFFLVCAYLALLSTPEASSTRASSTTEEDKSRIRRRFPQLSVFQRRLLAGLLIGLGMTIKPVLVPLLFIPLVRKNFNTVITAIAVDVIANIIGSLLMTQPRDYITITMPYLKIVRDFANTSLPGQLVWFGAPNTLILLWQLYFGVFVVVALVLLLRWVDRDEKFWIATTAGLLLTGAFFLSALGQQYYSIMLLPLIATVLRPILGERDAEGHLAHTVMLNWPAGLATALILFNGYWNVRQAPSVTDWFSTAIGGFGWGLLLLIICAHLIHLTIIDLRSGRSFGSGFEWARTWLPRKSSKKSTKKAHDKTPVGDAPSQSSWNSVDKSTNLESPTRN